MRLPVVKLFVFRECRDMLLNDFTFMGILARANFALAK